MQETELKIMLDAETERRLRRHPALAAMREGAPRGAGLVSIYFDTPDQVLARAGIALRLRRERRRWVQTVKLGGAGQGGMFSNVEIDFPAPGGQLDLSRDDPEGVYRRIATLLDGREPTAVFETRVQRRVQMLRAPDGGLVEFAIDRGEIVAGAARAPVLEAEFELREGEVTSLFEVARRLFDRGPVRFSPLNKAARGRRLVAQGVADPPVEPRKAGTPQFTGSATIETVARDVLRDCFAQIAENMVTVAASDAIEGPHQLRVGLRRLRTAFAVFGPSLGKEAFAGLNATARRLGQVVGALRDLDVLVEEVVAGQAALGLDEPALEALIAALEPRRSAVRAEVRAALASAESVGFVFDLAQLIEARGWLSPADYAQTERLAAPILTEARSILEKRLARVRKRGRKPEKLSAEELHELRKELKKLRYAADMLSPVFAARRVEGHLKALRRLQDTFGSLNDAAMARALLSGPEAPGAGDAEAQRAVGWVLGALAVRIRDDRPALFERWGVLMKAKPFWEE
jgi:inorganic triphosphatase YgiF